MDQLQLTLALLAIVAVLYFLSRRRSRAGDGGAPREVALDDVARIYDLLMEQPEHGKFAAILFGEAGRPPAGDDPLNVQFSIEDGRPGLDWVMLSPLNVRAEDRVVAFFTERGHPPVRRVMNDVPYLRVEGGDLPALGRELMEKVFRVRPDQAMILIAEGFDPERVAR